ncbi:MAG: phosphatidylinositol-3-phosphatase [Solirubrobacteraceae bacterium]|jgi:hypothetical protein|nr:phosphatidylinositol-3-phosphatase [Solirubrobacteraceae bacterium]
MKRLLTALLGAAALGLGMSAQAGATEGVPSFGHVFVIVGENTTYSQVTKNTMPYTLGTLEPESAWLTNYFATTHYSESNYVAMTSGQFTACEQGDGSIASCHQDVPNLFNQLDQLYGSSGWTTWEESMPTPCDVNNAGADSTLNKYRPKHNPALNFDDVAGIWSGATLIPSNECLTQDIPAGTTGANDMSTFNAALASTTPMNRFNYVVPNECEDSHDNCKPVGNQLLQFDAFLQREVPQILASPSFGPDGVLIVTFDEAATSSPNRAIKFGNGGQVVFAVISPLAKAGSYGNAWNHYSFLRTMQDGLGTSALGYLGDASSATAIDTIWK